MSASKNICWSKWIKIAISFLVILIFWFLPAPEPITTTGMRVIGVFIGTILLLSFVDNVWPAILAVALLPLTGVTTLNDAIAGTLGNSIVYFVFLSFILTYALNKVGFTDRLVTMFMSMKFVSKSPWLFTISMATIGLLLTCFLDQGPAVTFMLAFAERVYAELGYKKGDAYPHIANILVVFGVIIGGAMTPISHALALMGMGIYESAVGVSMTFIQYMAVGVPSGIIIFALLVLIVRLTCRKLDMSKFQDFDVQRVLKHKGKMDIRERITVSIFGATVFMWIFPGVAGMFTSAEWVSTLNNFGNSFWAILAVILLAVVAPKGEQIINLREVVNHELNWSILIFIAIANFLGSAMANDLTGVNAWITQNITPLISTVGPLAVILLITIVGQLLTNFASNASTITVMTTVGVSVALASNGLISPLTMALCTTLSSSFAYLLPSSFAPIAMLHSSDWSSSKKIYLYGLFMFVVTCPIIGFLGYGIGNFMA